MPEKIGQFFRCKEDEWRVSDGPKSSRDPYHQKWWTFRSRNLSQKLGIEENDPFGRRSSQQEGQAFGLEAQPSHPHLRKLGLGERGEEEWCWQLHSILCEFQEYKYGQAGPGWVAQIPNACSQPAEKILLIWYKRYPHSRTTTQHQQRGEAVQTSQYGQRPPKTVRQVR